MSGAGSSETPAMGTAWRNASRSRVFACLCILWVVVSVVVAVLYDYENLAFFLVFSAMLILPVGIFAALLWLSVPGGALYLTYRRLRARNLRAAAGWILVPVSVAALVPVGRRWGDVFVFELHKSQYQDVVRDALAGRCSPSPGRRWPVPVDFIQCKPPVAVIFPWGGFLSGWEGVVYDAADQISKPPALRLRAWSKTTVGQALVYSGARQSLGGHYYLASGNYP